MRNDCIELGEGASVYQTEDGGLLIDTFGESVRLTKPQAVALREAVLRMPPAETLVVWHNPQIPGPHFRVPVGSPCEAARVIAVLTAYDSYEYGQRIKGDYSNASGATVGSPDGDEWEAQDTGDNIQYDQEYFDAIMALTGAERFA